MFLGAFVIIVVGYMIINYFRDVDSDISIPSYDTESEDAVIFPVTHTVQKGEDLWKISEKYYQSGYGWTDIAKENNLESPYILSEGQNLVIPAVELELLTLGDNDESVNSDRVEEVSEISAKETKEESSGTTYAVVKGDTLWSIAVQAYGDGYKWVDIARENNLANPDLIHPGNLFVLP